MSDSYKYPNKDRRGAYGGVLPKGLSLHYDEDDPNLMNLRSRAALLDALLKQTLAKIDDNGAIVDTKLIRSRMVDLAGVCYGDPKTKAVWDSIIAELDRSDEQDALERKARKLVQEFIEVQKAETSRLVAIGGALTLQQIGGLVNAIMGEALRCMNPTYWHRFDDAEDPVRARAQDFITSVRRNILSTPDMNSLDALYQASNVRMTKAMGVSGNTNHGENVVENGDEFNSI